MLYTVFFLIIVSGMGLAVWQAVFYLAA